MDQNSMSIKSGFRKPCPAIFASEARRKATKLTGTVSGLFFLGLECKYKLTKKRNIIIAKKIITHK